MRAVKTRHVERQARRMHDMMDALNVDPGRLVRLDQGAAYADARLRCLQCSQTGPCLAWLENAEPRTTEADFCSNAALFQWASRDAK